MLGSHLCADIRAFRRKFLVMAAAVGVESVQTWSRLRKNSAAGIFMEISDVIFTNWPGSSGPGHGGRHAAIPNIDRAC